MKDSIGYCLKIQAYTKKHKDMYENDKTKFKIMFMEEEGLEGCNPEGAQRKLRLCNVLFLKLSGGYIMIILYIFSVLKYF